MGSGLNDNVFAACESDKGIVYVGQFSTAGGVAANGVSIYRENHLAYAQSFNTTVSAIKKGVLVAKRPTGTQLAITIASQPTHGSVVLNNSATGDFTYTAHPTYVGADSFTFYGGDADGVSNTAKVSVTISNVAPNGKSNNCGIGAFGSSLLLLFMLLLNCRFRRYH